MDDSKRLPAALTADPAFLNFVCKFNEEHKDLSPEEAAAKAMEEWTGMSERAKAIMKDCPPKRKRVRCLPEPEPSSYRNMRMNILPSCLKTGSMYDNKFLSGKPVPNRAFANFMRNFYNEHKDLSPAEAGVEAARQWTAMSEPTKRNMNSKRKPVRCLPMPEPTCCSPKPEAMRRARKCKMPAKLINKLPDFHGLCDETKAISADADEPTVEGAKQTNMKYRKPMRCPPKPGPMCCPQKLPCYRRRKKPAKPIVTRAVINLMTDIYDDLSPGQAPLEESEEREAMTTKFKRPEKAKTSRPKIGRPKKDPFKKRDKRGKR